MAMAGDIGLIPRSCCRLTPFLSLVERGKQACPCLLVVASVSHDTRRSVSASAESRLRTISCKLVRGLRVDVEIGDCAPALRSRGTCSVLSLLYC